MTADLVSAIGLLLAAAVAAQVAARLTGLSPVPLSIVAGLGLSQVVDVAPSEELRDFLLLSLAFLLFTSGIALNPARFPSHHVGIYLGLALADILVLGALGALTANAFGWDPTLSLYAGVTVAFSSTLLVTSLLAARGEFGHLSGRLALGYLLVQDACAIVLFVFFPRFGGWSLSWMDVAVAAGKVALLAAATWLLMRFVFPRVLVALRRDLEDRTLLVTGVLFLALVVVNGLDLPVVVGSFLVGVALSPAPSNVLVRGLTRSAREFFVPLLFVSLGMFVGPFDDGAFPLFLALLALVVLVKPLLVTLLTYWSGFTLTISLETALLTAQGSEFALAFLIVGAADGILAGSAFALLAAVTTVSLALTPLIPDSLVAAWVARRFPGRHRGEGLEGMRNHVLILGGGGLGGRVARRLVERDIPVVVVDHDPAVVAALSKEVPTLLGEGSDPRVLEAAGAHRAARVFALMGRASTNIRVLETVHPPRAVARVTRREEADHIRALGAYPLFLPEVVGDAFLAAMEEEGVIPPAPTGPPP